MGADHAAKSKEEFDYIVQDVLSLDKYRQKSNYFFEKIRELFDRLVEWLQEMITPDIGMGSYGEGIATGLSYTIVIVVGVILLIIVALVIRYIYNCCKRNQVKEILGEAITEETTPISLMKKARSYEEENNYRMSIRYTYIALLLLMDDSKVLRIRNTMTNTEIYECLSGTGYRRLEEFRRLMTAFNETWYGQKPYSKKDYETYIVVQQQLWNEVMTHEKA